MHPKLFEIPFVHLTLWTYGLMMVIGFMSAVYIVRRLSRSFTPDPQYITNAALYSLMAGLFGARLFYVIHYPDRFRGNLLAFFAIWQGGLELLGGVILAITVIFSYLFYHKLPIRRYLDILAIALMVALTFGRIGCFMKSCCFGKPTDSSLAVRFPYASDPYYNQIYPNPKRNRAEPHLKLPDDFFGYRHENGTAYYGLKPFEDLTDKQQQSVTTGPYRCLPVHPTQLYSSANAILCAIILYLIWRRFQSPDASKPPGYFSKPGYTFALMFILYGTARFFIEHLRDDNPFEYAWWIIYKGRTVSQNLAIYMVIFGAILMIIFSRMKPYRLASDRPK